jgi:uncharacterized protein YkwD
MRLTLATAGAVLALAAPAGAQTPRPECPGADAQVARNAPAARAAVLCIVNAERSVRGLPALAAEGRLDAAAQGHSDDMVARGYFDHVSPEGRTPADRADAAGYPWSAVYENIAAGQTTARQVMTDWMQSLGHCRGVLAPEPIHFGLGLALGGNPAPTWTQMFALPQDAAPASGDTAPADGCPYDRLSIAPGPARVVLTSLRRLGSRVTVTGVLEEEGAGRRIVVEARRAGRRTRRRTVTRAGGAFGLTIRAPRGRGRVRVTAIAPAVPDVYKTGRASRRI